MAKLTLKAVHKLIQESVNEYVEQLTPKGIKDQTLNYIRHYTNEVLLNLVGLERSWGQLNLIRGGRLGKHLDQLLDTVVQEVASDLINTAKEFKLTKEELSSIKKEQRKHFYERVKHHITNLVDQKARNLANELVEHTYKEILNDSRSPQKESSLQVGEELEASKSDFGRTEQTSEEGSKVTESSK